MLSNRSKFKKSQDTLKKQIAQQQTSPYPAVLSTPHAMLTNPVTAVDDQELIITNEPKKKTSTRVVGTIVVGVTALILYFVWQPAAPAPQAAATTQHTIGATTSKPLASGPTDTSSTTGGDIQVYIIGAVQHPGVYTLASNARVYQLLQAAGGAISNANLTVINMAARLSDGQEIYVPHIGETPIPAMSGTTSSTTNSTTSSTNQVVNINSASADQLRQSLHLSSKSAQDIVTYRLQHGAFSSVDALTQVLSKAVYNKIKDKVTV